MTTTDLARQSPLHRQHLSLKARLAEDALGLLPANYGDLATDTAQAVHLGLVDLCLMPRAGFKGAGAGHFLQWERAELLNRAIVTFCRDLLG